MAGDCGQNVCDRQGCKSASAVFGSDVKAYRRLMDSKIDILTSPMDVCCIYDLEECGKILGTE